MLCERTAVSSLVQDFAPDLVVQDRKRLFQRINENIGHRVEVVLLKEERQGLLGKGAWKVEVL